MTFIAVCVGLIALELGVLCVGLLVAVFRVKRAAEAFEVLTYRLEEQLLHFSNGMRSGWLKVLQAGVSVAGSFWKSRRE